MESLVSAFVVDLHIVLVLVVIAGALAVIVKGADLLVDEAVALSVTWGVPKMLIGATIVSLGTTLPETAVSVMAAARGLPGLALGNAVGSIIADTGLILGLAAIIGVVPIEKRVVNRQSWIQVGSAGLLIVASLPFLSLRTVFADGGRIPQWVGAGFLCLLVLYIWRSIAWSRRDSATGAAGPIAIEEDRIHPTAHPVVSLLKLLAGIALVVVGSQILIPAVEETAHRLRIPDAIIAATFVALGTSLPELVTAIAAVRKGHGELALGNVIGADILNVLFVAGASAALTPGGLLVPPEFFRLYFPSMIFVIAVLRFGISGSRDRLGRPAAIALLVAYVITVAAGYLLPVASL